MKKTLVFAFAAACALSMKAVTIQCVTTNDIGGVKIQQVTTLDADFANMTAKIVSVDPKPLGDHTTPSFFISTNPYDPAQPSVALTVVAIDDRAYTNARGMTKETLPATLLSLGAYAFENCSALSSVALNYNLRTIGFRPFVNTSISEITLPDTLLDMESNIAAGMLYDAKINISDSSHFVHDDNNLLYNRDKTKLYSCPTRAEGALDLPTTLQIIGADAFFGCFRLTNLTIPASVTTINRGAFNVTGIWPELPAPESSSKLKTIAFTSATPPNAADDIFDGAPASLVIQAPSTWPDTWKGRTITKTSGPTTDTYTDASGITWSYRVTGGVAEIYNNGQTAVTSSKPITSLTLPSTIRNYIVKSIGERAFSGLRGITQITVPSTYESIGDYAFLNCSSLITVSLTEGIRSLGQAPFAGTALASLTLPASVRTLASNPGTGADQLRSYVVEANNPSFAVADGVLYDKSITTLLACPALASTLTLPETVTRLQADAFSGCRYLNNILALGDEPTAVSSIFADTPADMTTMADAYACKWSNPQATTWKNRPFVNTASDDDGVWTETDVSGNTWTYTVSGAKVTLGAYGETPVIPSTTSGAISVPERLSSRPVTEIPELAFADCAHVTKITIPANIEKIAASAFNGCSALTEIAVATDSTAYRAQNKCLYAKDGKTLLRVPPAMIFEATQKQTVTEQQSDIIQVVGSIDEKTGLKNPDKIVSQKTHGQKTSVPKSYAFTSTLSAAQIFRGVTSVGNYAFTDCGLVAKGATANGTLVTAEDDEVVSTQRGTVTLPFSSSDDSTTQTSETVSSTAGFYNGEVCFYKTVAEYITTIATQVPITIPATVTSIAPLAFANAHFTNIYGADNSDQKGGGTSWTKGQKLPAWVAGNFNGVGYGADGLPFASATATISSRGKLSGKILAPSDDLTKGKTYTFSATAITDYDEATATFSGTAKMKIGKQSYALPFTIYQNTDGTGHLTIELPDGSATLVQNIWNRRDLDAPAYAKNAKVTVGGITYKYGTKGKVSWSGKVAGDNGKMLSVKGTSQLLNESQLLLYVPPKKNLLGGICELVTLP